MTAIAIHVHCAVWAKLDPLLKTPASFAVVNFTTDDFATHCQDKIEFVARQQPFPSLQLPLSASVRLSPTLQTGRDLQAADEVTIKTV